MKSLWKFFWLSPLLTFLALLSPGPDFFLILTSLLQKGARYTYGVILGITLGNAVILMVCIFGFMVLGNLSTTILFST